MWQKPYLACATCSDSSTLPSGNARDGGCLDLPQMLSRIAESICSTMRVYFIIHKTKILPLIVQNGRISNWDFTCAFEGTSEANVLLEDYSILLKRVEIHRIKAKHRWVQLPWYTRNRLTSGDCAPCSSTCGPGGELGFRPRKDQNDAASYQSKMVIKIKTETCAAANGVLQRWKL